LRVWQTFNHNKNSHLIKIVTLTFILEFKIKMGEKLYKSDLMNNEGLYQMFQSYDKGKLVNK
jgi:hypothetical protein